MQLHIYNDYADLSAHAADAIIEQVKYKSDTVLCLPSGDTPRLMCELLVKRAINENIDFSRITFIGLDEWVNIPPDNKGSCHYFFRSLIFDHLPIPAVQIHLFNGLSSDLSGECKKMDAIIFEKGGIDLMVVGIGMNGHIGFNEPGVLFENYAHITDLDNTTTTVGQKYFSFPIALSKGITLGLQHLTDAKQVILIANGSKKAGIIKKTLEEKQTNLIPASIIQTHTNGIVMIDTEAAASLDAS